MLLDTRVEKKSEGILQVHCKVAADYVEKMMNGALLTIQGQAALKGFRKGKAPLQMIKKLYEGQIKYETLNKILPEVYEKVVKEKNLKPIRMPEFDGFDNVQVGQDLDFNFTVEVMPEIEEFGTYEGASFKKIEYDYDLDEMLEKELDMLRNTQANYSNLESEAAEGDFVRAKYSLSSVDGEIKIPEKSIYFMIKDTDPYYLISKNFIGRKLKDSGSFEADFPAEFIDQSVAGKKMKVDYTLEEGKRLNLPEMNDEFAKKFNHDTVDALKETMKKNIQKKMKENETLATAEKVYEKIAESSRFSISPSIILEQSQSDLTKKVNDLVMQGKSVDQYLADEKLDKDGFIEKVKAESSDNIKKFLIVEKLAKDNGIEITENMLTDFIKELKETEVVNQDKIEDFYKKNKEARESLKERLKFLKVAELILSQVKLSGVEKKKPGDK